MWCSWVVSLLAVVNACAPCLLSSLCSVFSYLGKDLPNVFARMQQLEKSRLDTIKTKLQKYIGLRQAHAQDETKSVEEVSTTTQEQERAATREAAGST